MIPLLLISVVLILIIIFILCFNGKTDCIGGTMVSNEVLNRAYILFMKAQDINDNVIEAKSARDFWIADFIFSMANIQFAKGYGNTMPNFPLVSDRKMIKEILTDLNIWEDDTTIIDDKVEEIIKIIDKQYSTKDLMKTLSKRVNITDYATNLIKKMYPNKSKESIIALLLRYGSMYTYTDEIISGESGRNIYISKALLSIPPELYRFYNKNLPNAIECFASPINHTLDRYCALYNDDKEFGAIGPFNDRLVKENSNSSFIVNPPYDTITMNYVSEIIASNIENNFTVCLPSKDGGLFHLYEGRLSHIRNGKHDMNSSIDRLLRIPTLSGILIIPARLMYYWSYFKQKKQKISYDTIMFFYLKDEIGNAIEFIKKVQQIILKFGFGDHFNSQKQIYNIEESKIMELYPMNGEKIINSLKIKF